MFSQKSYASTSGTLLLTDAVGSERAAFGRGDLVYFSVTDLDRDESTGIDTLTVRVTSDTENTGTSASATSPDGTGNVGDGTVTVSGLGLDTTTETWTLTAISATEFVVRGSVSGEQSVNLFTTDELYTTDNDELSLSLTVGSFAFTAGDSFTFDTTAAEVVSETVTLTETGASTGVFTGSIALSEVTTPVADNAVLEIASGNQITGFYDDPEGDFGAAEQVRASALYAASILPGATLVSDTTLTKANSPYLLTGDLTVDFGVTLTLEPGVTLLFLKDSDDTEGGDYTDKSELIVNGTLIAQGTASDRITFASSSMTPSSADWGQITLNYVGATFDYVDIKHASRGIYAVYQGSDDVLSVDNSRFELISGTGIRHYATGSGSRLSVSNSQFTDSYYSISASPSSSSRQPEVQIVDNVFSNAPNGPFYGKQLYIGYGRDVEVTGNTFSIDTSGATGSNVDRGEAMSVETLYGDSALISDNTITLSDSDSDSYQYCQYGRGIYVRTGSSDAPPITISRNTMTGGKCGIEASITSDYSNLLTISDNQVSGTSSQGIYTVNSSDVDDLLVMGNTIEDNTGRGVYAGGPITLSENVVQRNATGLYLSLGGEQIAHVSSNIISGNTSTGVLMTGSSADVSVTLINNDLSGNGTYAIDNQGQASIDARQNWWGEDETAEIESGTNPKALSFINDGRSGGNANVGTVNYAGWLASSPTAFNVSGMATSAAAGTVSCSPSTVNMYGSAICTAIPNVGYEFDSWSGVCAGTNEAVCGIERVTGDVTVIAYFNELPRLPGAPEIQSAQAGDGEIRLVVNVTDDGLVPILNYAATCSDGIDDYVASASTPLIRVRDLTNNVPYTCYVTVENSVGVSPRSSVTSTITPIPDETPGGLPLWLLYEVSKDF